LASLSLDEALTLKKYDRVIVKKSYNARPQKALVMGTPFRVGADVVIVPYAPVMANDWGVIKRYRNAKVVTMGRGFRDTIERA
jgi:hypothetical protein